MNKVNEQEYWNARSKLMLLLAGRARDDEAGAMVELMVQLRP